MKSFVAIPFCATLLILSATLILPQTVLAEKHTAPKEPTVRPRIGREYPHDKNKDRIEDALMEKADKAKTDAERDQMVEVNLVFTSQINQAQIDAFEKGGGEIDHIYKAISYGWNGRCPLKLVRYLPKLLGDSMILMEAPKELKLHMINATQTGRVRPIWASGFGASVTGYTGSTNITIGIIDTGLDDSHTDLTGRTAFWYDYGNSTNTTPLDYHGHGTHVAGIALGSGLAGGSSSSVFNFTVWNNLSGAGSGQYYNAPVFTLPSTSLTWNSGARWNGGGSTALNNLFRASGSGLTTSWNALASASGSTPVTLSSGSFVPGNNVYNAALAQATPASVTDYVITNSILNYPAHVDGFPKFRGVAPDCRIAGARVATGTGAGIDYNYANSALDDMTAGRQTNKIKVINCSFSTSGSSLNYVQREYVNMAVANGIVVVVCAGNEGEGGSVGEREINDPGRAAYAITVGANSPVNQLCAYSSVGFTNPGSTFAQEEDYKPDLIAPGGSKYTGYIFSTDSNTQDGNLADAKANDYTPEAGTSMSSPFVAGCAALVIDAMEKSGHTWDFNSNTDPLYVKMLLSGTATESNAGRESGANSPTLQRAGTDGTGYPSGKDQYEGYGLINPDAAIEAAVLMFTNNTTLSSSFGGGLTDRRAWARKLFLNAGQTITVNLANPGTGDFDVYLYSATPGTYGKPVLLASSTSATTGANETFTYTATTNGSDFIVVKRVSGSGTFSIQLNSNSNDTFANAWTLFGASGTGEGNNTGYTKEANEPSFGLTPDGKTAWYNWTAPSSGTARFSVDKNHILKLYSGASVGSLSQVAATAVAVGDISSEAYYVTAGSLYRLAIDGASSSSGPFTASYVYDSVTSITFTNAMGIITPDNDIASPYPSMITVPALSGTLVKVAVTLVNFTNFVAGQMDIILVNPNNTAAYVMSDVGVGAPMTGPVTLTFSDDATSTLGQGPPPSTGTYKPVNYEGNETLPSPAPSGTYGSTFGVFTNQSVGGTWTLYAIGDGGAGSGAIGGIMGGWTLTLTMDQPPSFSMDTSSSSYVENTAPTQLSSYSIITDTDSADFSGGNFRVQFTTNGATEDRLVLMNQGTGVGEIGVSGNVVSYGGVNIGSYSGGTSGSSPLVVTFTNTFATLNAVQQLVTRVGYTNISENPSTATRTLMFSINDGDGGTNMATKNLTVTGVNDAPTLTTISTLSGALQSTPYTINYTNLTSAANEADVDNTNISFRVESFTGALTKGGITVEAGVTLLSTNESWIWTPTNTGSAISAFTVTAYDGALAS
ncbi:MAG: hypothetical protein JWM68_4297, partial [Verrucomicrobiales bacterium]|nr:hypothetical protein [Verrucomicrobiales bacterium]